MSENLGMQRPGSTFQVYFNTFDSNDPSASVAIAAFVLTDVHIYKDGGVTQRASDSGVTLLETDGIDFDGHVGIGGIQVDLADNDTAGFYVAGSRYSVVIGPTTVDAGVVNFVAATFEIGYPDAILNTGIASLTSATQFILDDGPAEADALIGFPVILHDVASKVQIAFGIVSDYIVTTKEVFLAATPVGFTPTAADNVSFFVPTDLHSVKGTTQTAGDLAALIVTADGVIDAIKTETDKLTQGDAGAGVSGSIIEEIENRPTTAMRGTDNVVLAGPTKAEMDTAHALLSTTADLLDKLGAVNEAAAAGDPSATESVMQYVKQIVNVLVGADGVAAFPAEAAPANAVSLAEVIRAIHVDVTGLAGGTVADIADAVQNEALEDHVSEGTVGFGSLLSVYRGPDGSGVFVKSSAANTNTVLGTDGTEKNPVSTFAAARTLADGLGVNVYYLEGNSDITLAATHEDWEFIGIGSVADNVVNLGSSDVDRSLFRNLTIEGTQGGTGRITARDCALQDPGAGTTTLHIFAERCGIVDNILVDTSADNVFDECFSLRASGNAPIITATGASGSIIISHYGGKIELKSLSASHIIELDGHGHVIFNADCNVNATVEVHGIWDVTDNTAGMSDLATEVGLVNMTKINTEADTALSDYDAPTKTEMDTAHALLATPAQVNTQVDGAWTTQMADSVPADGTISTREQALYALLQILTEFGISGTTLTVKKVDGSTTLMTFTLSDATNPVSLTRAT